MSGKFTVKSDNGTTEYTVAGLEFRADMATMKLSIKGSNAVDYKSYTIDTTVDMKSSK